MQEELVTFRGRKRRQAMVVQKSNPTVLVLYRQGADVNFHRHSLMNLMDTNNYLPVIYRGLQKETI